MDIEAQERNCVFPLEEVVSAYTDMLFRIGFSMLGSADDTEDVLQNVFLKYHAKRPAFVDGEHCKAWLIRVTINETKNFLRFRKRRRKLEEDAMEVVPGTADRSALDALMRLPTKYKVVMHLYYVEGYKSAEIARIVGITPGAVRKRLVKGREKLKAIYLEGEDL